VDSLCVQGLAEREGDALGLAQVGEPVPAEGAFAGDHQLLAKGRDVMEKGGGLGGQVLVKDDVAGMVEDTQVHCPGGQIDAAVECVRLVVSLAGANTALGQRHP
jgi:hypothetical protein